jgi:hypothetical protein
MLNSYVSIFLFLLILCFILPKLMIMEMEEEILCGLSEAHRGQCFFLILLILTFFMYLVIKNITEQHLSLGTNF